MCAVDYAEPWTAHQTQTRRAAKEHVCSECGRTIRKGESYQWVRGMTSRPHNEWVTYRTCAHCLAAGEFMHVICGGAPMGCLLDEFQDHWRDGYRSPQFRRMVDAMRAKWYNGQAPIPTYAATLARNILKEMQ